MSTQTQTRQQVARTLRKAAAVLRKNGYARGERVNDDGTHCMIGALDCVVPGADADDTSAAQALGAFVGPRVEGVRDTRNQTTIRAGKTDAVDAICAFNNEIIYRARKTAKGRASLAARTMEQAAEAVLAGRVAV